MQILEICNKISNKIVWLCPIQWIKTYDYEKILDKAKYNLKNLISHEYIGNPFIGNVLISNNIGIFVYGTNEKYENYDDIKFEQFSNLSLIKNIYEKIKRYALTENLAMYNQIDNGLKYYVNGARVRGHFTNNIYSWDWTTLFGKEEHYNFSKKNKFRWNFWNFSTIEECKNFIEATETDICMLSILFVKTNISNNENIARLVPWLKDYTHKWTDEMIAKELGITDEELEYIHKEMKPFGWKVKNCK